MASNDKGEYSVTALDYINEQKRLEREARELMPFDPNTCTYIQGELRQPVFACMTCSKENNGTPIGVCYSCSIQCHSQHDLIELFAKRNFVCDCGTTRMEKTLHGSCKLRSHKLEESNGFNSGSIGSRSKIELNADDIPSSSNFYNQNYKGLFCSCSKPYNPLEETGNMIQCYFGFECGEEWYHEACILGYFNSIFKGETTESENLLDNLPPPNEDAAAEQSVSNNDDMMPNIPHFPKLDEFDAFICWKCHGKFEHVFEALIKDKDVVLTTLPHFENIDSVDSWEEQYLKYVKMDGNDTDGQTYKKRKLDQTEKKDTPISIFLKFGFKEKLNELRDSSSTDLKLKDFLINHEYLYKEDPIFEPAEEEIDDDVSSTTSLLELGTEALQNLPRDQAIEGLQAYDKIKSRLRDFFKPFAEQGKVVTESEVREFFSKIKDDK